MTDCAPILVASAIAAEIELATWSLAVRAVLSWGDYSDKFEELNGNGVLVDVVPTAAPSLELGGEGGEFTLHHEIKTLIALRHRMDSAQRPSNFEELPFDEVSPYVNLYYEIAKWFMPSSAMPTGRRLSTLAAAVSSPPLEIVQVYDVDQLKAGMYFGRMRVTYQYTEAV